jgi:hypothetical protein
VQTVGQRHVLMPEGQKDLRQRVTVLAGRKAACVDRSDFDTAGSNAAV